ncbi:hypothetical protein [Niallia sp. Man26]|uniref:hypothetical protein n=1 Tax=Niallia sp. Man26 TaxID=2912824 RepID=UPI001EDB5BC8|nr:hypothetical protein [Niallia sp. Man26]UPO88323.1 hypothetical protein L8T27_003915 [Niallia sp. Man26]
MEYDVYVDVEAVVGNGTYSDTAKLDIVKLMMEADIVTIRNTSVAVEKVEVTSDGVIRFYGERIEV